jgi:hypothetical protein
VYPSLLLATASENDPDSEIIQTQQKQIEDLQLAHSHQSEQSEQKDEKIKKLEEKIAAWKLTDGISIYYFNLCTLLHAVKISNTSFVYIHRYQLSQVPHRVI